MDFEWIIKENDARHQKEYEEYINNPSYKSIKKDVTNFIE